MSTLITGADGYLGRRIAAALSDEDLILTVRAADAAELGLKRSRMGRADLVPVDLREEGALADVDPRRITRIVHTAATTRFGVDQETARQVNVEGTARVARFAARCPRLERFVHLSTLYIAGRRCGEVREVRQSDTGFVNHYEWSKWAAEEWLLDSAALPLAVLRLPTVIAEDSAGAIGQHNVFHHTLRLFYHGQLTLLPGEPATPLSLATADFVVDAVKAMFEAEPGIYHACAGPVPLGTAIDTAFTVFARDEVFQRRMLPRPVPCDLTSFRDLLTAARGLRGGPLHAAVTSVAPFAEQLYLPKAFRTDRLRAAWPGYREADPVSLVESVCAQLIARWNDAAAN